MSKRTRSEKDNAGPCPIMRACGGCAWLGVPYRKQLRRKQETMDELFSPLFERFGWDVDIDPIRGMSGTSASEGKLASPRAFRYKATTPFAPLPDGHIACGFYAAGTHRIVPAADCAVEAPGARRILNEVARVAEGLGMRAYDEDTHRGLLRHAVVRVGHESGEVLVTVVTNGDQTDTVVDFLQKGLTFEEALRTREFEPDAPNYTPRISGMVRLEQGGFSYKLSILKSNQGRPDSCLRFFYEYAPIAGQGHFIHTYEQDGNPLPSFAGEPVPLLLEGNLDVFTETIWNSLDKDNRVSLFTRFIDWHTGETESRIVNKHKS